jgi:sensor c-di-GMP phosphodiesterase-like protein
MEVIAHYQPIVDLATNRMVGCEALARWLTPDGVVRGPDETIAAIEADPARAAELVGGMLRCIGRDLAGFVAQTRDFYVSVNVPPILLGDGHGLEKLQQAGLIGVLSHLVIEITERQAMSEIGRSAIQAGREIGLRVALDDFGTGQSGLQQLIGLEVDTLKIDRSFVVPLGRDIGAERLIRAIVAFGAIMRQKVLAEGVETWEQALFLRAAGVDYGQGWYWAKAMPADELVRRFGASLP